MRKNVILRIAIVNGIRPGLLDETVVRWIVGIGRPRTDANRAGGWSAKHSETRTSRSSTWWFCCSSSWENYAKRPFAGPTAVLAYLSRYTHRVAISNSRLLAIGEHADVIQVAVA